LSATDTNRSQEFEGVKEKLEGLQPQLDRLKQNITTTAIDGDPEETGRRTELTRYAYQLLTLTALVNDLPSALEEIEKRSQELLEKGTGARFVDKRRDTGEVARLVERLREVITHYQVSGDFFFCVGYDSRRDRCRNNKRSMTESPTSL